ncbi:hypothetical protein HAX54_001148, partial [Datura stramonium]|nr:hypothetical protein [Datura stramonium]
GLTEEMMARQPSDGPSKWFCGIDGVNNGYQVIEDLTDHQESKRSSLLPLVKANFGPFGLRMIVRSTDRRESDGPSPPLSTCSV